MEYLFLIIIAAVLFSVSYLLLRRIVHRWFVNGTQLEKIREEVEKMLVELNHTTSRNVDLLESRVAELRELLGTVDKRIALLKREAEKHDVGTRVYNRIVKSAPVVPPGDARSETLISEPPLRDKILNLYHSGFSSSMIASQTGKTIGEVELIISLAEKD